MALPMIHLITAEKILHTHSAIIANPGDYYLGAIAPDAVHMRTQYDFDFKKESHLRQHSTDMKNAGIILAFFEKNRTPVNSDFLFGYCVHILTDKYWFEQNYQVFLERYAMDDTPLQTRQWAYYNDSDRLDFEMFMSCQNREEIWSLLAKAKGIDVLDLVSADEIDKWKERTLHWYDQGESKHKNPTRYLSVGELWNFTDQAARVISSIFLKME